MEVEETLEVECLPGETLLRIFYFLRPHEIRNASLVCHRWAQLLNEGIFWREYCEKKWEALHPVDERSKTWKQYFKERSILLPVRVVPKVGSTFYAKVNRYEDVDTLKAIIEAQLGIPVQDQIVSLTFQGKILRSGQLIGDYITQPEMSVSVSPRLMQQPTVINNAVNVLANNNNNNNVPGPGGGQRNN